MRRQLSRSWSVVAVFLAAAMCACAQYQQYPQTQYPPQYPQGQYPPEQYPQENPVQGQQYPPYNSSDPDRTDDLQRGVGRISVLQGDVNIKRGDSGEVVAAVVNAPVTTQDRIQTGPGSRAEVEFDYGNLVRLGPNTDLGMSALQYHKYQVQLAAGTIIYRVLRNSDSQAEIDTPSIAAHPLREGEYRVTVSDDGTTQITVRSGELEISGPRGSERIASGRAVLVRGDPADPEFQPTFEIARDQLDAWSEDRDRQLLASQSYRYVSPDIDGADDLDTYGTWVPSEYGTVWAPRAPAAGWAPYSYGHWAWEPYYGWSWIDYAPWGWAPYHYGRWFWNGGYGWCWWAGPRYGRHLWSPALVGFFGIGGVGVSVGIGGFGGLGWVALAPFEVFHPWWGHGSYNGRYYGRGGYGNLTIIHNTNITSIYRNTRINGGAITSDYRNFGGVNQRFGRANFNELRNASLVRGQIPATPTRASFQYGRGQGIANPRFAAAEQRRFYRSPQGASWGRGTFTQQPLRGQQGAGFNYGGNHGGAMMAPQNRTETRGAYTSRFGAGNSDAQAGWQRFGAPGSANGFLQGANNGAGERSGWHQFGAPQQRTGGTSNPAYGSGARSFGYGGGQAGSSYRAPAYREPAYRYSPPAQSFHGGGNGYSRPSVGAGRSGGGSYGYGEGSYRGGGGSYHSGGSYHGGGSSHGGGGGGHRGR